jgi:hypothetical protein
MACKSGEEQQETAPFLEITWKLVGFVDAQADTMKAIEATAWKQCYLLTFHQDGTLSGYTSTNLLYGTYEVDTETGSMAIKAMGGTEINELFDGKRYIECMYKVTSYNLSDKNLMLYYSPTDYLLFNPDEP